MTIENTQDGENEAPRTSLMPITGKVKVMYGMLATIGIKKGQPFNPDPRLQAILKRAARTAHGILRSLFLAPRDPDARYYPGKTWTLPFLNSRTKSRIER